MGLEGGTIFLGRGTANKNIFDYLGLNDKKKEIVLIIGYSSTIKKAGQYICQKLEFEKAHRGIAYVENVLEYGDRKPVKTKEKFQRREILCLMQFIQL